MANVANAALRQRITDALNVIENEETRYEQCGTATALYQIAAANEIQPAVTKADMIWVYDNKLSKDGQPGRPDYDTIRASSQHGLCPLCAERPVATLDHYLAKTTHPVFAVTPLNLLPACSDCNKVKLNRAPATADDQTLHPYFDDVDDAIWLQAMIVAGAPPTVSFTVQPPDHWPQVKQARVQTHFDTLELAALYGSKAAQELAQISYVLNKVADDAGPDAVRQHLEEQATGRRVPARNSWQAALYTALATSQWFWNGGHRDIAL